MLPWEGVRLGIFGPSYLRVRVPEAQANMPPGRHVVLSSYDRSPCARTRHGPVRRQCCRLDRQWRRVFDKDHPADIDRERNAILPSFEDADIVSPTATAAITTAT